MRYISSPAVPRFSLDSCWYAHIANLIINIRTPLTGQADAPAITSSQKPPLSTAAALGMSDNVNYASA